MKFGFAIFLLMLAGLGSYYGTPHWLHETECRSYDSGRHCAYIISCTYLGLNGWQKLYPRLVIDQKPEATCPGIAVF